MTRFLGLRPKLVNPSKAMTITDDYSPYGGPTWKLNAPPQVQIKEPIPMDYTQWGWVNTKKGVPETCGVYIISIIYGQSKKRKLMYVGLSGNLKQRLASHPADLFLRALGFEVKIHFFEVLECDRYERFLIETTQPPLNNRHCVTGFSIERMIKDDLFGANERR